MSSNEHPDMSGSGVDDQPLCSRCMRPFPEHRSYGVAHNEDLMFCSQDCADLEQIDYEEAVARSRNEA